MIPIKILLLVIRYKEIVRHLDKHPILNTSRVTSFGVLKSLITVRIPKEWGRYCFLR